MLPQIELLSRLGLCLLQLQATEHVIRLIIQLVLPPTRLSLEKLEALEEKERTKNLGYFLGQLRMRAEIDPDFDKVLKDFLKDRNTLIHNLNEVQGWDLNTEEGWKICNAWLDGFYSRADHVLKVFSGLVRAWEEQNKFPKSPHDDHKYFKELDDGYTFLAKVIFSAKQPPPGS
jgi:hypothetical protein